MNYRHAFHAGNFADVFKHVLLTRLIVYLTRKETPLRFIDTHAGAARYDLAGEEAQRAGEWREGIARLLAAKPSPPLRELLTPYLDIVAPDGGAPRFYPGSPLIAAALLRPSDRLLLGELHRADAQALRRAMAGDRRAKVMAMDGYQALKAATPPPERRGLVLIDPPFERPGEYDDMLAALAAAYAKWPTGVYALWHPLKDRRATERLRAGALRAGLRRVLALELETRAPRPGGPMTGCGLLVINPTHGFDAEAGAILPELAAILAAGAGAAGRAVWLAGE
jgi:23S rRNA (adenine2030-N6)-methyltransferase